MSLRRILFNREIFPMECFSLLVEYVGLVFETSMKMNSVCVRWNREISLEK